MCPDLSCKFSELARSDPLSVIDTYSIARLRLSVLMSRMINSLVAFIFPFVIKIDESVKAAYDRDLIDMLEAKGISWCICELEYEVESIRYLPLNGIELWDNMTLEDFTHIYHVVTCYADSSKLGPLPIKYRTYN